MPTACFIAEVVDRQNDDAASLWLIRDRAVHPSSFRLAHLSRFDERIEANIDGLRIAETSGWSTPFEQLDLRDAGDYFVASILALVSQDNGRLDQIIEHAYGRVAKAAGEPYHPAYDPWRGIVSGLAWVDRAHAAATIERLFDAPKPRTRWLGVAACGARRYVRQSGLEAALADREPLVRARAARTIGELGRTDLRAHLSALLTDADEDCRFWASWSAARLGMSEGLRVLAKFSSSPGRRCDFALDLLLRSLSIEDANAFIRPLARSPEHRRSVIRATAAIGDPLYIPWLIERTEDPAMARIAGFAIETITGADLAAQDLNQTARSESSPGPTYHSNDDNVMLSDDEDLLLPDPKKVFQWWGDNKKRFSSGTAYFLGIPKKLIGWTDVLRHAAQRQRWAAALELSLRKPEQAMFEVRARAFLQHSLLKRAANSP
jgi:uncharacterized protein (TIGR02270 family)